MKHAFLGFFCTLSLCATTAAMAATPRIVERVRLKIAAPAARSTTQQCTNFSGSWQGTCVDDEEQSSDATMDITQEGCEDITIDGLNLEIEGAVSLHTSPSRRASANPYNVTVSFGWDDTQTKLHGLTVFTVLNGMHAGIINQRVWLEGDRLRFKDEKSTSLSRDGSTPQVVGEDCTFERVKAKP